VLCGLINKKFVSLINVQGGRAVGISGVDATLIQADIRDPELGLVGEVQSVDGSLVRYLIDGGYIPVVSPVSSNARAIETNLNVNADTVAAAVAGTLGAERLIFLTDVPGVLDKDGNIIRTLTPSEVRSFIESEVIFGGMVPKVEACIDALSYVSKVQIADGRETGILRKALEDTAGSLIVAEY
jgi:acetylglutamate kinase